MNFHSMDEYKNYKYSGNEYNVGCGGKVIEITAGKWGLNIIS
jgi:hypothetical protein